MYIVLTIILYITQSFSLDASFPKQDVKSLPAFFLQQEMWHPHLYLAKNEKENHIEIRDKHKFYPSFMTISFKADEEIDKTLICNCQMNKLTEEQVSQYAEFQNQLNNQNQSTEKNESEEIQEVPKQEIQNGEGKQEQYQQELNPQESNAQQVKTIINSQFQQNIVTTQPNYFLPFVTFLIQAQQQLNLQNRYLLVEEVPSYQYIQPIQQISTQQQSSAIYTLMQPLQYNSQNVVPYLGFQQLEPQSALQLNQQTPYQSINPIQMIQVPVQQQTQQPVFLQSNLQSVPINQVSQGYQGNGFLQSSGNIQGNIMQSQNVQQS